MHYVVELAIPADTAEADMEKAEIRLPQGVIKKVGVFFPWGCAGMVKVKIFECEHQVWPTHLERHYSGDNILIEFPEDYELPEVWNLFSVRGWSPDTNHAHTPIVFFSVLEEKVPSWARLIFGRLLGGWR